MVEEYIDSIRGRELTVVLPEGKDERVIAAARRLKDEGIAEPIVLGDPDELAVAIDRAGIDLNSIVTVDPCKSERLDFYTDQYGNVHGRKAKFHKRLVRRPLFYGGMMVRCGDADSMVGGIASPTASVIQAGALTVGFAPGIKTPSSFFLMIVPGFPGEPDRPLIFADCAVNVNPTAEELADIALASEASARRLLRDEPRVALLSFSTKGSAAHRDVTKVTEAVLIAKEKNGDLKIDGEFQADAALIPLVASKKVAGPSDVAGQANVLIFPDLDAGNIAYKLTQYLAKASAFGPILQGFARPVSDVSRGASVDDIVAVTAITLAMRSRLQVEGS